MLAHASIIAGPPSASWLPLRGSFYTITRLSARTFLQAWSTILFKVGDEVSWSLGYHHWNALLWHPRTPEAQGVYLAGMTHLAIASSCMLRATRSGRSTDTELVTCWLNTKPLSAASPISLTSSVDQRLYLPELLPYNLLVKSQCLETVHLIL